MTRLISLHSQDASIVLEKRADASALWRHWGAPVDPGAVVPLADTRGPASFSFDQDVPLSLAPTTGLGWFGPANVRARRDHQNLVIAWTRSDATQEGACLIVTVADDVSGVKLEQRIEVLEGGAFRLAATVTNTGAAPLDLDWLASAMLPLPARSRELVSWRGRHNAELVECVEPMPAQSWVREGRRGISGHGGAPGVFVNGSGATRGPSVPERYCNPVTSCSRRVKAGLPLMPLRFSRRTGAMGRAARFTPPCVPCCTGRRTRAHRARCT